MRGAIPPLPQYVFVAWCLVKHRENFTFTFTFTFGIVNAVHLLVDLPLKFKYEPLFVSGSFYHR
jgi:hypothetical protein